MITRELPQREAYLRKKRRERILRYGIIVFIMILLIGVISYVAHRPSLRISKVELNGGVLVTQDDVSKASLSFVQGSYFYLFPKNTVFWFPKSKLATYLKNSFQRIDTIDLGLKDFRTLNVTIKERSPYATWCDTLPEPEGSLTFEESEKCYFLDLNSTIFAEAPLFSGDAYFKYYGLVSTTSPIGKEFISSSTEFIEISLFVDSLKKLNLEPIYLVAKEKNEFTVVLNGGTKLFFDTKEPLSITEQNLSALLSTKQISGKINLVDYIDLRFGNKLFYKLK